MNPISRNEDSEKKTNYFCYYCCVVKKSMIDSCSLVTLFCPLFLSSSSRSS